MHEVGLTDDTDQVAVLVDYRQPAYAEFEHEALRVLDGRIKGDAHWLDGHQVGRSELVVGRSHRSYLSS
jgi:hypothetical protein